MVIKSKDDKVQRNYISKSRYLALVSLSSNKWKSRIDNKKNPTPLQTPQGIPNSSVAAQGASRPGWSWGPLAALAWAVSLRDGGGSLRHSLGPTELRRRSTLVLDQFSEEKNACGVDQDHSRVSEICNERRVEGKSPFFLCSGPQVWNSVLKDRRVWGGHRNDLVQGWK